MTSRHGNADPKLAEMGWNALLYDDKHSFAWKRGADLIELLAPKEGERILDLGCGTGRLTAEIAARGASVLGLDNSPAMIARARSRFPKLRFEVADARDLDCSQEFDAVFSNAALHWMSESERVVQGIAGSLSPGGRFVAEFGGKGNLRQLLAGVREALEAMGIPVDPRLNPWYFPSVAEYAALIEKHGLAVTLASLFDRPTPLEDYEDGMRNWFKMFGVPFLDRVPSNRREELLERIERALRPGLYRDGAWFVDYRRLRIVAIKEALDCLA